MIVDVKNMSLFWEDYFHMYRGDFNAYGYNIKDDKMIFLC